MVSRGVFAILRKMKPLRQIEAAEMMISASRLNAPYAKMILAASRSDTLVEAKKPRQFDATPEDIARMERQMEKLYQDYKAVEDTLGETLLVLVVAKGFRRPPAPQLRHRGIYEPPPSGSDRRTRRRDGGHRRRRPDACAGVSRRVFLAIPKVL